MTRAYWVCLLIATGLSTATAAPVQWPVIEGGNNHFYDWVPGYMTWTDARNAASSMTYSGFSGYLATVTSSSEQGFFQQHFSQTGAGSTLIGWLGGYQDTSAPDYTEPSGGWRWTSGEPWGFTTWWTDRGLPDDFNGSQDYLRTQPVGSNVFWDDIENDPDASYIGGFFVEYPVPEPTSITILALGCLLGARQRRPRARSIKNREI
jgi:hypothetical protein